MEHTYKLDDEALCALVDIVRFGKVDVVDPSFKDLLLQKLAAAAVVALFGEHCQPNDLENGEGEVIDLEGIELVISFARLYHLPELPANKT